jgi:hypothetical protein
LALRATHTACLLSLFFNAFGRSNFIGRCAAIAGGSSSATRNEEVMKDTIQLVRAIRVSVLLTSVALSGCTMLGDEPTPELWQEGQEPGLTSPAAFTSGEPGARGADGARVTATAKPLSAVAVADTPVGSGSTEALSTAALGSPRKASTLGYNMDYPGDWTNAPPFIDQMRNARALQGVCAEPEPGCDVAAHLDLDAQGWVKSLAYKDDPSRAYERIVVVVNSSSDRPDIGQTFAVTWEGQGNVDVFNGADIVRTSGANRLTFRLQSDITMLFYDAIAPADHLRNVRVVRTDHEALLAAGEIFQPDLLAYLEPFGSLRFMDWMESNSRGQCSGGTAHAQACYTETEEICAGGGVCLMPGRWDQRPTHDQPSQLGLGQYLDNDRPALGTKVGGYSVETLVALANRVGADPHFNMPAAYDDEYVRAFAEHVRDNLAAGLTASVEYSNEVWNWGFPQADYANLLGRRLWPDEGSAWVQYAAGRTSNMCRIWKEVFSGQERRLRCLISPQTGWRELAETALECPAWVASHPGAVPCYAHVDAINITGYFSGCLQDNAATIRGWLAEGEAVAMDRAFEQLEHGSLIEGCEDSLDGAILGYGYFKQLADARGLGLYVSESGTHFSYYDDEQVRQFLVDMTQDERMYAAYQRNFAGFRAAGGSIFNVWGWLAPNDAWSNANSLVALDHPKYRAIVDFADPGTIP